MARAFSINQIIWHGSRYWVSLGEQGFVGWNIRFLPYRIVKLTAARITCESLVDGPKPISLNREVMTRLGKQYHTRFHEYFYAEKPAHDPERRHGLVSKYAVDLNLPIPYTKDDVRRAYKRLALIKHPDVGGSQSEFIALKKAHDEALRAIL